MRCNLQLILELSSSFFVETIFEEWGSNLWRHSQTPKDILLFQIQPTHTHTHIYLIHFLPSVCCLLSLSLSLSLYLYNFLWCFEIRLKLLNIFTFFPVSRPISLLKAIFLLWSVLRHLIACPSRVSNTKFFLKFETKIIKTARTFKIVFDIILGLA